MSSKKKRAQKQKFPLRRWQIVALGVAAAAAAVLLAAALQLPMAVIAVVLGLIFGVVVRMLQMAEN